MLDEEPDYYFEGRAEIKSFERTRSLGKIELEVICDPYKWELMSSDKDWLWDSFNFETGIICDYKDLEVNDTLTLTIPGSHISMVPTFILTHIRPGVSSPSVYASAYRKHWNLSSGKNRFAELIVPPSGLSLTFFGVFTLSIDVKGGSL